MHVLTYELGIYRQKMIGYLISHCKPNDAAAQVRPDPYATSHAFGEPHGFCIERTVISI